MSSNEYSACVSRNLVRTSTFGYRDHANLCALLETTVGQDAQRRLSLASMTVFPNFGIIGKVRTPTAGQSVSSRGGKAVSQEMPIQI
ncbi:hypothetical protein thsrh120_63900 [Rhizobium sp. No.120]